MKENRISKCIIPSQDVMWEHCGKLIRAYAARSAKYVRAKYDIRYEFDDLLGCAWEQFLKCLELFDPSLGFQFSTYYYGARHRTVDRFVRKDSMRASLRLRSGDERYSCELNDDSHESGYFMYRIPDLDDSWTDAILELFDGDKDKLWRSLTEHLKPNRRLTVLRYYRDGATLDMIATELNLTRERVRQFKDDALLSMAKKIASLTDLALLFGVWDGVSAPFKNNKPTNYNKNPAKKRGGRRRKHPTTTQ